jgi:uncharacterized membrane protein
MSRNWKKNRHYIFNPNREQKTLYKCSQLEKEISQIQLKKMVTDAFPSDDIYSMWKKVIPFLPSSLYISYKTIYFHNILMKSFLI